MEQYKNATSFVASAGQVRPTSEESAQYQGEVRREPPSRSDVAENFAWQGKRSRWVGRNNITIKGTTWCPALL
jgi:hypothetical protein